MPGLLAIDPGLKSTGWAYWKYPTRLRVRPPTQVGLIQAKMERVSPLWHQTASTQSWKLSQVLEHKEQPLDVYCEMPVFFSGTAGGMAAAQTDSLQKLCYLVGMYAEVCNALGIDFNPVRVPNWKGQLPKDVVKKRITGMLGEKSCRNFKADIWDAVGIGLHAQGLFS